MESKWLRASLIAVLSLGIAVGVRAEDKNAPPTPVRPEDNHHGLRFTGSVQASPSAGLSARVIGTVDKVNVDEGDRVKKGQVLIELSAPELKDDLDAVTGRLDRAKAEVEQAEAAVQEAEARPKPADVTREAVAAELARRGPASTWRGPAWRSPKRECGGRGRNLGSPGSRPRSTAWYRARRSR